MVWKAWDLDASRLRCIIKGHPSVGIREHSVHILESKVTRGRFEQELRDIDTAYPAWHDVPEPCPARAPSRCSRQLPQEVHKAALSSTPVSNFPPLGPLLTWCCCWLLRMLRHLGAVQLGT